VIVTVI